MAFCVFGYCLEVPRVPVSNTALCCRIVHQHVFEVMKLAFKEILTTEESTEKAYVLWSTFVEPFFGLQPHRREEWELDQKQSNAAQQHHLRRNPSLRATALSGEPWKCQPPALQSLLHTLMCHGRNRGLGRAAGVSGPTALQNPRSLTARGLSGLR